MSLPDLAAIGNFVSGIAVVVTLIVLLFQIRQTNKHQKAIVQQNRVTRSADFILRGSAPGLVEAWIMGAKGSTEIGIERHWQFITLMRTFFLGLEDTYFQYKIGLVGKGTLEGVANLMHRHFAEPGVRAAWRQLRDTYDPDFAKYCDSLVTAERGAAVQFDRNAL